MNCDASYEMPHQAVLSKRKIAGKNLGDGLEEGWVPDKEL
jgi:hypothetical protein